MSGHKLSIAFERPQFRGTNNRSTGRGFSNSLWRIALLASAAAVCVAPRAQAAIYYARDSEYGLSRPAPDLPRQRRQQKARQQTKKPEVAGKESAKPQGPLIISVQISNQVVKVYDANGLFAEGPVSTGMPGHPTPMGVFSVIEKQKLHHSNIYSGAPMPFMQRITWSGIAMHAGVLPGRPASHGCIRLNMAFAVKLYGWTRMGARVFVTPSDIVPASFAHPLLVAQKVVPQPAVADDPKVDSPTTAKTDKGANADPATLELRSTVGHADTRTADASNALPAKISTTMSDAGPAGGKPSTREGTTVGTGNAPSTAQEAAPAKPTDTSSAETKTEPAKSETAKSEAAKPEAKPAETVQGADLAKALVQASKDAVKAMVTPDEIKKADEPKVEAKVEVAAEAKVETRTEIKDEAKVETKAEIKADDVKAETAKADPPKSAEKPDESAKAEAAKPPATETTAAVAAEAKDQTRLANPAKPERVLPAAKPNGGQIAVFISRKDSKLYVRQNFSPLFAVPVTIAPSNRPLGTHVFTAQADKNDANILHWSVVTLPAGKRSVDRGDEDVRRSRNRKVAAVVEAKDAPVTDSPAEALDRITIPADAMARITEALSTGGSIIVSDQGINAGETGEGTDFIVALR